MTSSYPSTPYLDLIQTYQLSDVRSYPQKSKRPNNNSIWEILTDSKYSIFRHIILTAQCDKLLDDIQFNGTLLLTEDESILRDFPMEMFTEMDRNTARILLNYHIFPTIKSLKSIMTRTLCKMDTKNPHSEIIVQIKDNVCYLNNGKGYIIDENIKNNGTILFINCLLIPPELYSCQYTLKF